MLSCDGSSMTLAWKSPKHCGGSKINAYYIDKRDADTLVWKEVNLAGIRERVCTVSGNNQTQTYTIKKVMDVKKKKKLTRVKEAFLADL